jgi:hypothetical protein
MTARRFPPPWTVEDMTADRPMTAEQAATLKRLAEAAYELETFQPNLKNPVDAANERGQPPRSPSGRGRRRPTTRPGNTDTKAGDKSG